MRLINRHMEVALDSLHLLYRLEGVLASRGFLATTLSESEHTVGEVLSVLSHARWVIGLPGKGYRLNPEVAGTKTLLDLLALFDRHYLPNPAKDRTWASWKAMEHIRRALSGPVISFIKPRRVKP